jgi:hypothetical protein
MLLPIVLLLATAGPIQQVGNAAAASAEQSSKSQPRRFLTDPGSNTFVRGKHNDGQLPDEGMIIGPHPCVSGEECRADCLSITAYVFSDGENPQLKYVTDCPNLDVPLQNKRAQGKGMGKQHQPTLKRTNLDFHGPNAQ